jgi:transglutaminase-like putative cysteine protease
MRLSVRHVTTYAYAPPVERCALRLRLYPTAFESQRVLSWTVSVNGKIVQPLLTNATADKQSVWTSNETTEGVEIVASGEIETSDTAGVVRGLRDLVRPGVFLRSTPLTQADAKLKALGEGVTGGATLKGLHALNEAIRDAVDYKSGVTSGGTTAAQALKLGAGVCQDHAHVFIAAARAIGVPARYVVGYLFAPDASQTETHAWAEAHVPDIGWIGFDPANRICPTDRYVRVACGLDAADAAPVRGSVAGSRGETLEASVDISQTQQ